MINSELYIDLEPMWLALAEYQPYADADGHGESWRRMCEQRTQKAIKAAQAHAKGWLAEIAKTAEKARATAWAPSYSRFAIRLMESTIKDREREHVPS
jgi:hypothetical protein